MKVQSFTMHYGDGDKMSYILFASGTVMRKDDGEWQASRLDKATLVDSPDTEFNGWIEAPCAEEV